MIATLNLYSQKILPDTFYIDVKPDTLIELKNICIDEVVDNRDEDPRFVRYNSKNKYLLIPVDQEVYLQSPLANLLKMETTCDSSDKNYRIEINKFQIEKQKGKFRSLTYLVADLPVYEKVNDAWIYRGTFFYDYLYLPQVKKEKLAQSTENVIGKWQTEFKLDLLTLCLDSSLRSQQQYSNFIADRAVKSLYMNTTATAFMGYRWWGFQGEISFTRPETNARSEYSAGIFRYQNTSSYQSFAIGKQSKHILFRRSDSWLFDVDFNFLIGFCKWKDVERDKPTLYQLFDLELSSVQSVIINPINSKGLILRFGIIENMNYVVVRRPEFQAGLVIGLGLKI